MVRYLDDDEMIADGQSLRVPLELCDAKQRSVIAKLAKRWPPAISAVNLDDHRPRHGVLNDEVRELRRETRDSYLRDLTSAWKTKSAKDDPGAPAAHVVGKLERGRDQADTTDAMQRCILAREEMIKRAENAWRRTARDFAEPDLGSRPSEWQRHQLEQLDPKAAQARRDEIYRAYVDRLGSAWKTVGAGPGNPGPGPGNVGPRPAPGTQVRSR
jgi:hypothetical protein